MRTINKSELSAGQRQLRSNIRNAYCAESAESILGELLRRAADHRTGFEVACLQELLNEAIDDLNLANAIKFADQDE